MIKTNSRTTNTIYNFVTSIGAELVSIIMKFIVRTVFINTLGKSYLGIGSLFSNILSMLSLVDLGVGSAILFKLYDPLARRDEGRIRVLMKFYRTAYRVIGLAVAAIGVCLIPFLPALIKDIDKLNSLGLNATIIFLLYLFKSVSSYLFFAYRSAIIKADQKTYILQIVGYFFTVLTGVLQIVSLLVHPNFVLYICIGFVDTIIKNIVFAIISDRMYPFLKEKTEERMSREEVKGIFKDCGALFLYKINRVVVKATDNIVLSAFMGLETVGLYSNYYIFYTTIKTMFTRIFNSVAHSIGNLHATSRTDKEYKVFEAVMLVAAVLGGTAFVGIFACADEFVEVWIGSEWVLPQPFSLLMGLELFTLAVRAGLTRFRTAMGLFQQAKFRPVASMLINIVVSVALVNVWGICGVLVGTIASDWLTYMWFDPIVIHKYGFKGEFPVKTYFLKCMTYFVVCCIMGVIDWFICSRFFIGHGWFSVAVHILICGVSVPAVLVGLTYKTPEGKYLIALGTKVLKKIQAKFRKKQTA